MSCITSLQIFKFTFIPVNVIIMALTVTMIVLSSLKIGVINDYDVLTDGRAQLETGISIAFLMLAPMATALAALGCLLALKQTPTIIASYFAFGLAVSCSLMAVGIAQLNNEWAMRNEMTDAMMLKMADYNNNSMVRHDITIGQMTHNCCGAYRYSDWWIQSINYSYTDLPKSCCTWEAMDDDPINCNVNITQLILDGTVGKQIKTTSCGDAYANDLGTLPEDLGVIGVVVAWVQVVLLVVIVQMFMKTCLRGFWGSATQGTRSRATVQQQQENSNMRTATTAT